MRSTVVPASVANAMTQPPAHIPPTGGDGPFGNGEDNPFGALFGGTPGDLGTALHRFADLLSWQGGPVNWSLARETALRSLSGRSTDSLPGGPGVADALRLADLWLDAVTVLPSGVTTTEEWDGRRWIEATLPAWQQLVDPVARHVVEAMGTAMSSTLGSMLGGADPPAELAGMTGPLLGVVRQMSGAMFGAQVGQALASLAGEVVSATDVGLPLGPHGTAALLPGNIAAFGAGLGVPSEEVVLFVALREAAHRRLFGHVPWLRAHLFDAVAAYARGITVDMGSLDAAVREIDPTDPESLQRVLSGGLFTPQTSAAQRAALARLETALALVEGWVDEVVSAAAGAHLPTAGALRETVRRRRAEGGPAEQTFATLVGLELRPRRLREAAELWRTLGAERGPAVRDALWDHPDLLPSADDLDDPVGFARRPDSGAWALPGPDDPQPPSDEPPSGEPPAPTAGR